MVDPQGFTTTVMLSNVDAARRIDPKLFVHRTTSACSTEDRPALRRGARRLPPASAPILYAAVRLTVTTWNINSVRLRIEQVGALPRERAAGRAVPSGNQVPRRPFPAEAPSQASATRTSPTGQKGYQWRRDPLAPPVRGVDERSFCGRRDARHIA